MPQTPQNEWEVVSQAPVSAGGSGGDWSVASESPIQKTKDGPPERDDYAIPPMGIGPLASGMKKSSMKKATSTLPYVGAGAGALAGEGLGSIPGAAIGGAGGESLRQLTNRFFGIEDKKVNTSAGAASEIGKVGVEQGALEGVTAGIGAIAKPIAGALKESAAAGLGKILAPTTIADKALAKKILPRMVEESPIAISRKSLLEKAGNSLKSAGDALDEALNQVPAGQQLKPSQVSAITGSLDALADSLMVKTAGGGKAVVPGAEHSVQFINGMKEFVQKADPSFSAMRKMRKILDSVVDKSGKWNATAAEGSQKEIQRFTANRIREELARSAPDVAAANKDYSFYKGMQTILEHTAERKTGQTGNLTRRILMAGGAAAGLSHGPAGVVTGATVMKGLAHLVDSTAWRTVSAATKSKIANLIATDNLGEAAALIARAGGATIAAHSSGPPTLEEAGKQ